MIVQCDSCQAKYKIADEKVKGKAVKIRCAKCSHVFTVRPADQQPAEVQSPEPVSPPVPEPAAPQSGPAAPSEPPVPPEKGGGEDLAPEDTEETGRPAESPANMGRIEDEGPIGTYQPPIAGDENIPLGGRGTAAPPPEAGLPPLGENQPAPPEPEADLAAPERLDLGPPPTDAGTAPPPETALEGPLAPPGTGSAGQTEPSDLDWGNIALDTPAVEQEASSDLGLAGSDKYQPPPPPPPTPVEEEPPSIPFSEPEGASEPGIEPSPAPSYQPAAVSRSGGGKGLILFLVLLLALAAGGYFYGYPMYREWRASTAATDEIGLVITNQTATAIRRDDGNVLSAVRGRVRNDSGKSVGLIEVSATFLGSGDQELGEASSFAGNQFTDEELRTGDLARIRSELQYELGQGMSNNSIKPGEAVPFLILLENSPLDIKRVSVNVKGYKETT